jgi:hypothetical protein
MGIITAVAAIAGAAATGVGAITQMSAAKDSANSNKQIAADQQRQEALRQQAMELDAKRRQVEFVRQQQRSRAASLTTATASGSEYGSGLEGAYGQSSGATNTNMLGVSQSLQLGQQNFGISKDITNARYSLADAGASAAFGAGLSSLGGALITSAGALGKIGQGFGSTASSPYDSYGTPIRGYGPRGPR